MFQYRQPPWCHLAFFFGPYTLNDLSANVLHLVKGTFRCNVIFSDHRPGLPAVTFGLTRFDFIFSMHAAINAPLPFPCSIKNSPFLMLHHTHQWNQSTTTLTRTHTVQNHQTTALHGWMHWAKHYNQYCSIHMHSWINQYTIHDKLSLMSYTTINMMSIMFRNIRLDRTLFCHIWCLVEHNTSDFIIYFAKAQYCH